MTSTALAASSAFAGTPRVYTVSVKVQMTIAPTMLANSENRPPLINVPPITTDKMASNS